MAINLAGYLYSDNGTAIANADVTLVDSSGNTEATTTTSSAGLWTFAEADEDVYDIKLQSGSQIRYIKGADKLSVKEIDVRNNAAATTPAFTFTNYATSATSHQVGRFRSLNSSAADGDEVYISFNLQNSAGEDTEFARITGEAVDVTNGQEDGQLRFGVAKSDGTITDVLTINSTTGGSTDMTLDVSGDLTLDADGGDILFKDGGTTFGSATNTSGNLIIKSGTTTALTFSGANLTAAGTIGSGAITSTGIVTGTGFTAGSAVLAEAELELLDGLTAGTAIASKVVTTDANVDTTGQRNLTISGELDAATLDISGNADIDGTTNLDAVDIDGAVQIDAAFTSGVDGQGYDTKFFGDTSGAYMLWDTSADDLVFAGAAGIDLAGDIDVDGTANLDAVDIDGAVQIDNTVTVGVDDTGYDVKFFGDTASAYMLWDTSADDLVLAGSAGIDLAGDIDVDGTTNLDNTDIDGTLAVDGTTISLDATTSLNIDNSNTSNGITLGTATSGVPISIGHGTSETTVNDNLTVTGNLTVSGTTTTVSSSTLTIGDTLIKLGQGYTGSAYDQGFVFTRGDGSNSNTANRAILWDESADIFVFANTNTEAGTTSGNVTLNDYASIRVGAITADDNSTFTGTISAATGSTIGNLTLANGSITDSSGALDFGNETLTTTGAVDLGAATLDSVTSTGDFTTTGQATDWDLVDNNASALSFDASGKAGILEIVTTNSSEAVKMSGDLDVDGTAELDNITIGGAQGSDGQVLTSTGSGVGWEAVPSASIALDDVGTGDGATTLATTVGNITIDAQANDADVIIKVDDNGSAVTAVTFDGSDEGNALFVNDIKLISDSAVLSLGDGNDFTITHDGTTGATLAGNPITITSGGAATWSSSAGALTLTSAAATTWSTAAGVLTIDGDDGIVLNTGGSGNVQVNENLVVGVDDTGYDVTFFGDTASRYWLWDTSADGVVQRGTLTVGVDDTGHDVKFFGASAGAYMEWDESADQLRIMGASADATTSTGKLLLATSLTDINANDVIGKIDFQAPHEAGGTDAITVAASIQAIAQGTFSASVNATDLIFYTGHSEAATEKFRITSQGELGVGGANYGTDGQVLTSTGAGTAPAWEDAGGGGLQWNDFVGL